MNLELASAVRAFLASEGSTATVTGPTAAGALVVNAGLVTHFVGLERLGKRYAAAEPGARRLWLERLLLALRPAPTAPRRELVAGRLLPRLRTTLALDQQRVERGIVEQLHGLAAPDMLLASRPFEGGLSAMLAFEMAEEAVDVAELHLAAWGLDVDAALAQAVQTLRTRSGQAPLEVAGGLFASTYADGYDAARLLLPELWKDLPVRGRPVAMVPHQEALFIAGSDDDAALEQLATLALELGQQPLGLSAQLFLLGDAGWEPWAPAPERPCARPLEVARLPERVRAYERQKALIEAQAEADGVEAQVAPFLVLREDDGALVTATVWLEGTEPLLARATRIAFAPRRAEGADLKAIAIPWDEAAALPGVELVRTHHAPERWRAKGFPALEALEGL